MRRLLLVGAIVIAMLGMSGVAVPTPALADSRNVDSWIELSTVTPSPGCAIEVSVEVRSSGAPVVGVEIELALHQDTNLIAADYGVTNDSGIDYLTIDTSDIAAGVGYWLDINLGGNYLTGTSIVGSADSCGTPKQISTSGDITVVPGATANTSDDSSVRSGMTGTGAGAKVFVPSYHQQRNLSCEFASIYIATSAFGNPVSEYALDDVVGLSPNPHLG
jgi:hypothetical protein